MKSWSAALVVNWRQLYRETSVTSPSPRPSTQPYSVINKNAAIPTCTVTNNEKYYRPICQEYNENSPHVPHRPPLNCCYVTTLILAQRVQLTCNWKHKTVQIIKDNTKWLIMVVCRLLTLGIANELNPLKPELNSICYLLALLGAHHFLHVSRIRVKLLTFRRQMSYIYGAPILDVSRSHTTTQHSR